MKIEKIKCDYDTNACLQDLVDTMNEMADVVNRHEEMLEKNTNWYVTKENVKYRVIDKPLFPVPATITEADLLAEIKVLSKIWMGVGKNSKYSDQAYYGSEALKQLHAKYFGKGGVEE